MSIVNELPVGLVLTSGSHAGLEQGMCAMEAAAYIAGEPWSDHPQCVSPVIAQFMRSWNDCLPNDADRTRLLAPLVPLTIGTRTNSADELARAMLAVDWSLREWLPSFLELVPACAAHASALRSAKPIQKWEDFDAVVAEIEAAKKTSDAAWSAAWSAASDAAWSAARYAAWSAARYAARSAASDAASDAAWSAARSAASDAAWSAASDAAWSAAWSAARSAASDAAWSAASDAAWSAAGKELAPTVEHLQESAVKLVERMCAVGR